MDSTDGKPSAFLPLSDGVPQDGLRILYFDDGSVRGKASLILMKELMDRVGQGAKTLPTQTQTPTPATTAAALSASSSVPM